MAGETLRVPSNAEPTFWNKDAGTGAAIGYLIPAVGILTMPAGALIGGFMGKDRMRDEQKDGKDVNPPTFWNRSVITGAAVGEFIGEIASGIILGAAFFAAMAALPDAVKPSTDSFEAFKVPDRGSVNPSPLGDRDM